VDAAVGVKLLGGLEGKADSGEMAGKGWGGWHVQWKILIPIWIEFSQLAFLLAFWLD
jgi:hypothetical protein